MREDIFLCFQQITQCFYHCRVFLEISIPLNVTEGERFPAHLCSKNSTSVIFAPSLKYLILNHLINASVTIGSVLDVPGWDSGQDFMPIVHQGLGVKAS